MPYFSKERIKIHNTEIIIATWIVVMMLMIFDLAKIDSISLSFWPMFMVTAYVFICLDLIKKIDWKPTYLKRFYSNR